MVRIYLGFDVFPNQHASLFLCHIDGKESCMNNPKLQKQYYNVTEIAELLGIPRRLSESMYGKNDSLFEDGGHVPTSIRSTPVEQREVPTLDEIRYGNRSRRS